MKLPLLREAQTRPRVERRQRRALEQLDAAEPRPPRGVKLAPQDVMVRLGRTEQVAVHTPKIAVDLLVPHNLFDAINGQRMALRGQARVFLAAHTLDLEVAIVQSACQVGR